MEPLISVVIPIYNCEETLHGCVDSVLKQTYKNIEILLIDDGSADKSGIICDEYADKHKMVRVFHLKNGGPSKARNFGINESSGDYIQFLDSDDTLPESTISQKVSSLLDNNADQVVTDYYQTVDDSRTVISNSNHGLMTLEEYALEFSGEKNQSFYFSVVWNKLFNREILKKNNILFKEGLSFAEDYVFNLQYLVFCKNVFVLNKPLYSYKIVTSESSLSRNAKLFENIWKIRRDVLWPEYKKFYESAELIKKNPEELKISYLLAFGNGIYVLFKAGKTLSEVRRLIKEYSNDEYLRQIVNEVKTTGIKQLAIKKLVKYRQDFLLALMFWLYRQFRLLKDKN